MTSPAEIAPDTKDWTWVLDRACDECGFDAGAVDRGDLGAMIRDNAAAWHHVLASPEATQRPEPTVWSPTEYAAHVRDVHRMFAGRVGLMLSEDDPTFANWDQDESALEQRYWEQRPAPVAAAIRTGAERIAESFASVDDSQWGRTGRRSNGTLFTIDTFARYFLHDIAHHAWDVTAGRW